MASDIGKASKVGNCKGKPPEVRLHESSKGRQSARDMKSAPLPPGWEIMWSSTKKRPYYYNKTLRKSQWKHPVVDSPGKVKAFRIITITNY